MRRIHADLMLLGCAAIWGFAFLFQKSAMAHMGPFLFIACRGLVASLALAPLVVLCLWIGVRPAGLIDIVEPDIKAIAVLFESVSPDENIAALHSDAMYQSAER